MDSGGGVRHRHRLQWRGLIGLFAVGVPAVDAHRLPGYMLAVLALVSFGAFEIVTPFADAVSRLSHHLAADVACLASMSCPCR